MRLRLVRSGSGAVRTGVPAVVRARQFDRGFRHERNGRGLIAIRAVASVDLVPPVAIATAMALTVGLPPAVPGVPTLLVRHLPIARMALGALFLIDGINPKIMLSMLVVVFRRYPVTGPCRIACESQIFFVYLKSVSTDPHTRSVAVEKLLTIRTPAPTTAAARAFRALALFHVS